MANIYDILNQRTTTEPCEADQIADMLYAKNFGEGKIVKQDPRTAHPMQTVVEGNNGQTLTIDEYGSQTIFKFRDANGNETEESAGLQGRNTITCRVPVPSG